METYIALLRGINVGGRNLIAMADLRTELAALGFQNVRTLLQSGNVVFGAPDDAVANLEARLEAAIEKRFECSVSFIVRTAAEWSAVIGASPYHVEAEADPSHLLVTFLKSPPEKATVAAAQAALSGPEYFTVVGREIFAVFPDGIGTSKLPGLSVWKKLAGAGTGRNWTTVLKLAQLAGITNLKELGDTVG